MKLLGCIGEPQVKSDVPHGRATRLSHVTDLPHNEQLGRIPNIAPGIVEGPTTKNVASLTRVGFEPEYPKVVNQDAFVLMPDFWKAGTGLYAVMDGHGRNGHLCSTLMKDTLPAALTKRLSSNMPIKSAIHQAVLDCDIALTTATFDCSYSGTTLVLCIIDSKHITTAWVGDSRAVLVRRDGDGVRGIELSLDHRPDQSGERERILRAGGRVEQMHYHGEGFVGPFRVFLKHSQTPGLAMSRSLADEVAHNIGVSAEVDINVHEINKDDAFVVITSDGVTEMLSSQEIAEHVESHTNNIHLACKSLIERAYTLYMQNESIADDSTAIVIRLNCGP